MIGFKEDFEFIVNAGYPYNDYAVSTYNEPHTDVDCKPIFLCFVNKDDFRIEFDGCLVTYTTYE